MFKLGDLVSGGNNDKNDVINNTGLREHEQADGKMPAWWLTNQIRVQLNLLNSYHHGSNRIIRKKNEIQDISFCRQETGVSDT